MLGSKSLTDFISALSSKEVAPGGGSLGFLLISLGSSIILKTVKISQKFFPDQLAYQKCSGLLESFSQEFLSYVDKDASDYIEAVKYVKTDKELFNKKLYESTRFLVDAIKKGYNLLNYMSEFSAFIKDSVYSDLECGKYAITAGLLCLIRTGYTNLKYIKALDKPTLRNELETLKIKIDQIKYTL